MGASQNQARLSESVVYAHSTTRQVQIGEASIGVGVTDTAISLQVSASVACRAPSHIIQRRSPSVLVCCVLLAASCLLDLAHSATTRDQNECLIACISFEWALVEMAVSALTLIRNRE